MALHIQVVDPNGNPVEGAEVNASGSKIPGIASQRTYITDTQGNMLIPEGRQGGSSLTIRYANCIHSVLVNLSYGNNIIDLGKTLISQNV